MYTSEDSGTGYVAEVIRPCIVCRGTGRRFWGMQVCRFCGGTGKRSIKKPLYIDEDGEGLTTRHPAMDA